MEIGNRVIIGNLSKEAVNTIKSTVSNPAIQTASNVTIDNKTVIVSTTAFDYLEVDNELLILSDVYCSVVKVNDSVQLIGKLIISL